MYKSNLILLILILVPFSVKAQFSSDSTLDVSTWNIEWFGSSGQGPANETTQLNNAAQVMNTLGSDIFALQEINGQTALNNLINALNELVGDQVYTGFVASHIDQAQKTAYVYNTDVIQLRNLGSITNGGTSFEWAGRFPYTMQFDYTANGSNVSITAVNIHAKCCSDQSSYERRQDAAAAIHDYFETNLDSEPIIFLGDYNDDVDKSIYQEQTTPYIDFVIDIGDFKILSKTLSDARLSTTVGNDEVIDHITITDELFDFYVNESVGIYEPNISGYGDNTSDHYPVYASFIIGESTSSEDEISIPTEVSLSQNYPNPFNPSTTIEFTLNSAQLVNLRVFNILGQEVANLANQQQFGAGTHALNFNAAALNSGIYFYTLETENGNLTRQMTLIK